MTAQIPVDETERLAALRSYDVLDTPPEEAFDDLALLAAQICQVPMALVSLVDRDRQWFKARIRMEDSQTPRGVAFCAHTILHQDDVFIVHDATTDARFADNPLVNAGPKIRFYAGAPLVEPGGHVLGALCVMDRNPRTLTLEQVSALRALSRSVMAHLELRKKSADLAKALKEGNRHLEIAEESRRALLNVLEDEKAAGQRLRASEAQFRQLTESIDEVFWLTDPNKGTLVYISPAYERIWGRTCESLYQRYDDWILAVYPEDRDRIVAAAKTKQLRGDYDETYRIMRPDGTVRWLHERAFPVRNSAGEIYRVAGVAQDITEKKELESQFFRAQRLESIGTLAGGIAHDLNNILAPIMMAGPLLRMSNSPERTEKMLGTIESSAQRGAKLVRQLLTFGRGAEGEKRALSVAPAIEEMLAIARQTFPKNITIITEVAPSTAPIMADATQVHQVLLNLCVNARDAMPEGGILNIVAENVHVDQNSAATMPGARAGDYVMIKVVDTGTGMTPKIVEKIFDPFFTTKAIGKGTGLGLATVMGLVKSHDGFLTLSSEPGKGSAFRVHFPTAKSEVTMSASSTVALPFGHGELLLIVDDEESIRDTLRGTLIQYGYTVLVAENGIEAISRYATAKDEIKLMITDLDMPQVDGVTMIRILKRMDPKLKIIVSSGIMSGNQNSSSRTSQLTALGVAAFLDKPYTVDEILRTIHDVLSG